MYRIRTVRTASNARAVQVVRYHKHTTEIVKHIGSAHNNDELEMLRSSAKKYIEEHQPQQLSLFPEPISDMVAFGQIKVTQISHRFARTVLLSLAKLCGLAELDELILDLTIMRIIEPCSKLRTIELLRNYFNITYSQHVYKSLPKLIGKRNLIEAAAIQTARTLSCSFSILLYDVTTLYFETHKPDDDLQARGFSKDAKSQQPQIVVGLLVTEQGFPLLHEVFKGNTFEGHTMLSVVKSFQKLYKVEKPIIVADSAMLSQENRQNLEKEGYPYIVGARLANTKFSFLHDIERNLPRKDGSTFRMVAPQGSYDLVCSYSHKRYNRHFYP